MKLFTLTNNEALEIASQTELPVFVYKLSVAEANWRRLQTMVPARVRLAYAVKANPGLPLLRCFAGLGASFDCASAGELARLISIGVDGSRILFAGPGKSDKDITSAIFAGARLQVDCMEDISRINQIAKAAGSSAIKVNIRVNPLHQLPEARAIIGGSGPSAFGVDEENLADFLAEARQFPLVSLAGLHMFTASNELDYRALLARHEVAFTVARDLQHRHGLDLNSIDLGGGLGIAYSEAESELSLESFGNGLEKLLQQHNWFKGEVVLEPGRWLAGPCGVYLTKVTRSKVSRGQRFVIVQEGINHLLRPLLTGQPFPVCVIKSIRSTTDQQELHESVLAGPLCTGLDRLGTVELPELENGSVLMFGQTGAYGRTEAMNDFLCREAPRELWLE